MSVRVPDGLTGLAAKGAFPPAIPGAEPDQGRHDGE